MKRNLLLLLFSLSSCTDEPGKGNIPAQVASDSNTVQHNAVPRSQMLYEQNCMSCHGGDGTAGISGAANLQHTNLDSTAICMVIRNGRGGMPAFNNKLSQEEVHLLAGYIHTLKK